MNTLLEKITDLNQLILTGKAMEAFEKFYHADVSMQENQLPPTRGKDANRKREMEFFNNVTEFRGARVLDVAVGDQVTMVVWHYDYTHRQWGERNYQQVSVQHWLDGQIVHEQFFYGN